MHGWPVCAMPDLQLPSWLREHHRPLAIVQYTAWWQTHVHERPAQGHTQQRMGKSWIWDLSLVIPTLWPLQLYKHLCAFLLLLLLHTRRSGCEMWQEVITLSLAVVINGDKMTSINTVGLVLCLSGIVVHVILKALAPGEYWVQISSIQWDHGHTNLSLLVYNAESGRSEGKKAYHLYSVTSHNGAMCYRCSVKLHLRQTDRLQESNLVHFSLEMWHLVEYF